MKIKGLILLIIIGLLCGCGGGTSSTAPVKDSKISFTDDEGLEINLEKPAERIISLYSAHTENIYSLGGENRLIGGYKTCTYPPEAAFLPMYDYNGDPEAVIGAEPDVVIIRPFIRTKAPDFVKALENAGITVVSLYPDSFEDFDEYINKLALITGTEDKAEVILKDFHNQLEEISRLTSTVDDKQTVFFESTENNVRTVAHNSMPAIAIELAGGINLAEGLSASSEGGTIAEFGAERVLLNGDNIDVYISQRGSMNSGGNAKSISERDGFDTIKAIKEDRFYTINEKIISSPTFRFVKGVREVARFLYPDVVDDYSYLRNDEPATRSTFAQAVCKVHHLPIEIPTSSSYYKNEQKGHYFGLFEDVKWQSKDFDYIETAVLCGYVDWFKEGDKEYFYPDNRVTRDELAQTLFVMSDLKNKEENTPISDLGESDHPKIVQILVDNGILTLNEGKFEPERQVTNNEIINALELIR